MRSPLTGPGVNVKEGDYLLAVNGKELKAPVSVYSLFENTAGKLVDIRVGSKPDGSDAKTVQVVPVESENDLRNRYWVENNLKKVNEATQGRVAYVYVPNTSTAGHDYFKRYFFPQSDKDAIIIDERFNGGGSLADYIVDILRRPYLNYWATRYGQDIKAPNAAINGPKVMLVNEFAGSGGDYLPWSFRKLNLGTIIGKRTWGGLSASSISPALWTVPTSQHPMSHSGTKRDSGSRMKGWPRTSRWTSSLPKWPRGKIRSSTRPSRLFLRN